jgi:hypothetical protein
MMKGGGTMARWFEPTAKQEAGWAEWVASRPDNVRSYAERFSPFELYRMKSTGQRVTIRSFDVEMDGKVTMSVIVRPELTFTFSARCVFGIDPDDLEPCDLPEEGELVTIDSDDPRLTPPRWVCF